MAKNGKTGMTYEQFGTVWEQLLSEGRAASHAVLEILGGSKSTIAHYREQYEREKSTREMDLLKQIELPDALIRTIAAIKVKQIAALENKHQTLEARIDEHLKTLRDVEAKNAELLVTIHELKTTFDTEKLEFERKLAASQARIDDFIQREQKFQDRYDTLNQQVNQAKQDAAVAKKESELLRERKVK